MKTAHSTILAGIALGAFASATGASPAVAKDAAPAGEAEGDILVFGRGEAKIGTTHAASEGGVAGADLLVRPLLRVAELLEAVLGMVAAQHSGSGKANQCFCGFIRLRRTSPCEHWPRNLFQYLVANVDIPNSRSSTFHRMSSERTYIITTSRATSVTS